MRSPASGLKSIHLVSALSWSSFWLFPRSLSGLFSSPHIDQEPLLLHGAITSECWQQGSIAGRAVPTQAGRIWVLSATWCLRSARITQPIAFCCPI